MARIGLLLYIGRNTQNVVHSVSAHSIKDRTVGASYNRPLFYSAPCQHYHLGLHIRKLAGDKLATLITDFSEIGWNGLESLKQNTRRSWIRYPTFAVLAGLILVELVNAGHTDRGYCSGGGG